MKSVQIVGAGFSGLTLAYYLVKRGFRVTIFDKAERPGGLIETVHHQLGQIETAANALMSDGRVEELFEDLDIDFADRKPTAKRKYIYWDEPKRWPLSWSTSWLAMKLAFQTMWDRESLMMPSKGESIKSWACALVNSEFEERLVTPALQGIYAGDSARMSSSLILKSIFKNKPPKGKQKGSVAPHHGMGDLIQGLVVRLKEEGVDFHFDFKVDIPATPPGPLVISTAAWSAGDLLASALPEVSRVLKRCEPLPLIRVTAFFKPDSRDLQGFGCLFPKSQGFRSLGVLFNDAIFENRSEVRSESWILGGAFELNAVTWSDHEVLEMIRHDRHRLYGYDGQPLATHISRWSKALPHYTVEWERELKNLSVKPPFYLHGNYLGQLGLSRILGASERLAERIAGDYGN
ncbi:MAG: NAD(P)/FAD-dependent oxidoreductase [Bdellovibrionales bacterium]